MNVSNDYAVTIFKNENTYGTFYKVGLSKKDVNGNYINGYKDCRFKKDIQLENKTKIYIKKAWIDFYVKDKKTIDYIFISEFEIATDNQATKKEPTPVADEPFTGIEINDDDLPF